MKRILYILVASLFLFSSCDKDEDSVFKDSPDTRLNKVLNEYKTTLTQNDGNWVAYYMGSAIFMKFNEDNTVEFQSTFNNGADDRSITYRVGASQVPELVFESHSVFQAIYEDNLTTGEYEFLFDKVANDRIDFISKTDKGANKTKLTFFKETKAHFTKVMATSKLIESQNLEYAGLEAMINKSKVKVNLNAFDMVFNYTESEESKSEKTAFILTPTGFHFLEPFSILGITVQDLNIDIDNNLIISKNGKLKIDIKPYIAAEDFMTGKRLKKGSQVYYQSVKYSPSLEELIETVKTADPDFESLQFYVKYMLGSGNILTPQLDFYRGQAPKSGGRWIEYYYNFEAKGKDKVLIEFLFTGNGAYYPIAKPILNIFNGEFTITPDPKGFILTSTKDSKHWIEVQ